ncbi:uncharacterized protein A1O9_12396 [Exophiala aquamarina CBS 119918]|uniref:Uncharacterized protein n=1 Tax=Exophiala aquamarina CBS 119918 TaxID=1182545 RepID=A0A072NUD5_9EURO|nr:uncharacterized protein A1O9_12396 [Exophiala aquamarina CBS 119918]KEF51479.1 hypothetical protein A1O9_12396 [Exophiala aquamarina CBS 119918]
MPLPRQRPTYFLPPNFLNPPGPASPIRLGQLISNPSAPTTPITRSGPLDPKDFDLEVHSMPMKTFRHENQSQSLSEGGVFIRAVQGIVAKLNLNISREAYQNALEQIDHLVAEFIELSEEDEYVEKSLAQKHIQDFITKGLFKKRVFMVTGIKIAYPGEGDSISAEKGSKKTAEGGGDMSAVGTGSPLEGGGNFKTSASTKRSLSFIPDHPFIYAYRLRECFYGGRSKETTKGALLSRDTVSGHEPEALEFDFQGVGSEDVTLEDMGPDGTAYILLQAADDLDGTQCDLVVPKCT